MKTYNEYLYLQIYKTKCILKDLETLQNSATDKATRNDILHRVVIKGEALANNLRQMLLQYSVVTPEIHKEQISRRNGYLVYADGDDTVDIGRQRLDLVDLLDLGIAHILIDQQLGREACCVQAFENALRGLPLIAVGNDQNLLGEACLGKDLTRLCGDAGADLDNLGVEGVLTSAGAIFQTVQNFIQIHFLPPYRAWRGVKS